VARTALRLGRWTPQESAAQLRQAAVANLSRFERIDLLAQIVRWAQRPAAPSLFQEARTEALRQWCIVAAERAAMTGSEGAAQAESMASQNLNLLYRFWAEQRGWIDDEGRLRPLDEAQREEFSAFIRAESTLLRDTVVNETRLDSTLTLLARFASDLGGAAPARLRREAKGLPD